MNIFIIFEKFRIRKFANYRNIYIWNLRILYHGFENIQNLEFVTNIKLEKP